MICPCPYPELPHPITRANQWFAEQRSKARGRNAKGEFLSASEEAWAKIPEGQRKALGYRKPRKQKGR